MTIIARVHCTQWEAGNLSGEINLGGNDYRRLSGRGLNVILATVKGKDWEKWTDVVKGRAVTKMRTKRSWRFLVDDTVHGRLDVVKVEQDEVSAELVTEALEEAESIAKPETKPRTPQGEAAPQGGTAPQGMGDLV